MDLVSGGWVGIEEGRAIKIAGERAAHSCHSIRFTRADAGYVGLNPRGLYCAIEELCAASVVVSLRYVKKTPRRVATLKGPVSVHEKVH